MKALGRVVVIATGLLGLCACTAPSGPPAREVRAEFGIFYGGQVQERDDVPFELDASRQRQGFRLVLSPPPAEPLEVNWELGRPGMGRRSVDAHGRKARPRQVQLGRAHFRPGEGTFEQVVTFSPEDPLGLWNIRVQLGAEVVIDRPFLVYDPVERARRSDSEARSDAGL